MGQDNSQYSDPLQAGRFRGQIPVGMRFSTHSLPYNGYWAIPGGKVVGHGVNHPPPSSAKVKEMVELYPYFPPGT